MGGGRKARLDLAVLFLRCVRCATRSRVAVICVGVARGATDKKMDKIDDFRTHQSPLDLVQTHILLVMIMRRKDNGIKKMMGYILVHLVQGSRTPTVVLTVVLDRHQPSYHETFIKAARAHVCCASLSPV